MSLFTKSQPNQPPLVKERGNKPRRGKKNRRQIATKRKWQ